MKRCLVCHRRIKTGYKYCFEHRNTQAGLGYGKKNQMHKETIMFFLFGGLSAVFGVMIIFANLEFYHLPSRVKFIGWLLLLFGLLLLWLGYKTANKLSQTRLDFNIGNNKKNFIFLGLFLIAMGMAVSSAAAIFGYILVPIGIILIILAILSKRKESD